MHDPEYYAKFTKKWQNEYNAHVRALEKRAAKGFEEIDRVEIEEVDAKKEMKRAKEEIKLREDRKAVTTAPSVPAVPKMKITVRLWVSSLDSKTYFYTGCQNERSSTVKTSTGHNANGSLSKPGGLRGTDS